MVSMATYRIPEGELSLAHAAKTSGEHFAIRQENSSYGPGTLMGLVLLLSARHTIIHHNTAHIHSKLSRRMLLSQVNTTTYSTSADREKPEKHVKPCNSEAIIFRDTK